MNVIEVKRLAKSYGDVAPLRDLELHVQDGEFVSITGPSGSGKTTFLNVLAGLLTPCQGEVVVEGVSLYDLDSRDRSDFRRENFGFIFQSFNLINYFTAIENIEVPLYLGGKKNHNQRNLATELLERVGLKDKAASFPSTLSIGEQQRVAIARALANDPKIVFADEPTGNLDERNALDVMGCLKELNDRGITILLVTHDNSITGFAHRNLRLTEGRLVT